MEQKEQLERAHAGDREARNQMVEENLGLVWSIVRRFSGRGYEEEDLFQVGCIGLMKAIDRFDTDFDVRFSTYAVPMITGEIKRFLRDDGIIKVSRSMKENGWKIAKAAQKLQQELGRSATVDEIAAATELTREEIVLAMEAGSEVDSLDRTLYESEGKDVLLGDQVAGTQDNAMDTLLDHMLLSDLISGLEEKEQLLIQYRYFHEMTQTQTAKLLHISQVQVSRMEKKILQTMRRRC